MPTLPWHLVWLPLGHQVKALRLASQDLPHRRKSKRGNPKYVAATSLEWGTEGFNNFQDSTTPDILKVHCLSGHLPCCHGVLALLLSKPVLTNPPTPRLCLDAAEFSLTWAWFWITGGVWSFRVPAKGIFIGLLGASLDRNAPKPSNCCWGLRSSYWGLLFGAVFYQPYVSWGSFEFLFIADPQHLRYFGPRAPRAAGAACGGGPLGLEFWDIVGASISRA